jgi:peptide/nickel transport system substrate-binding protein
LILSFIMTSCGTAITSSSTPISTTSASVPASSVSATNTTAPDSSTPEYGGTLRVIAGFSTGSAGGWPFEPQGQSQQGYMILETLIRGDNKGKINPWLAESFKLADDHKSVTFNLRNGVKFHDGSDFNADVAKWNLDNYISSVSKQLPDYVLSVDKIDDYTIRVNFSKWDNTFWTSLENVCFMISKIAFEKNGKEWCLSNPIGTGAFKFVSFDRDTSFKAVKNPNYWGKDAQGRQLPYLDGIDTLYISDPLTSKATMQAKEADMTDVAPGKGASDYQAMGLNVLVSIGASLNLIGDTAHADSPFSKKEVREALEYAIDRETIAKAFGFGYFTAPYQIQGPANVSYNPNFTLGRKYDPDKAKQLLATSGYPDGFKCTMSIIPAPFNRDMYVAVQNYLAKVGIQIELGYTTNMLSWLDQQNSLHSVLNMLPFMDFNGNFNMSIQQALGPTAVYNKNWQRTDEFMKLYNASIASNYPDTKLINDITDYLVQEALVTPFIGSGLSWAIQPYVMNGGWYEGSIAASWKPEQTWLDK